MRTALYSDVAGAARVLLGAPPRMRPGLCRDMILQAETADRFVRRLGKLHPEWGNGTLLDAARRRAMMAERSFDDAEYCACFILVLTALGRRPRHPDV